MQLEDQAGEYQEMCSDCLVLARALVWGALWLSPHFHPHFKLPGVQECFFQSHHKPFAVPLLHPPLFTPWHPMLEGDTGEVGLWQDRAAFARDDTFCDRRCKGGAPTGDCLQRDTSAAASVAAMSRQCVRFYGTFITICHSFNGMGCASCHLPPATPVPPLPHAHTCTLRSSAIWP